MRIHIIGAGPTGMSLAWELKKYTDHEVSIYDKKTSCGGAWWEPDTNVRDIHAHKILFDQAFVNTHSLLNEMGIKWDEMFEKVNILDVFKTTFKNLNVSDYIHLLSLALRVLSQPNKYKGMTLQDSIGSLSENGKKVISALPYIMDGVGWETMSAYEFIKSFDYVMEVKYPVKNDFNVRDVTNIFPQRLSRNSKYVNGIDLLKEKYIFQN